jgi:hypothetical protein
VSILRFAYSIPQRCRCRRDATRSPTHLRTSIVIRPVTVIRKDNGALACIRAASRALRSGTAELRARLNDNTPELELLGFVDEYRALIRNAFAVMVHHASVRAGLRAFAEDQARLTDELGPVLTAVIRDSEARQWSRDTGLCPVCGDDDGCDMCRDAHEAGAAD